VKAEEFVAALRFAMPSAASLSIYGLDDQEIRNIQASFDLRRREVADESTVAGEIGRLISSFESGSIEIGLVRFSDSLESSDHGWRFGFCEADPLYVTHAGNVVLLDHTCLHVGALRCASTPERFLDALALRACMGRDRETWRGRASEAASRCCIESGEPESIAFHEMMCAFLDDC
jgi:hypothetical protein